MMRHPKLASNRRTEARGARMAAAGTTLIHAAAVFFLYGAVAEVKETPPVYAVKLVAAPRSVESEKPKPEVVQRQAEAPPPTPQPTRRNTVAEEAPPPPPQPEVEREPAPASTPDVELAPGATPSTGTDPETVEIPGIDFPFPGYLRNIVAQVYRRWQKPAGNVTFRAEVLFLIKRDGSISNFQFVERSGNLAFDLNAQGAVEAAAAANAFGPLPDGYPNDVLPVSFFFDPSTLGAIR